MKFIKFELKGIKKDFRSLVINLDHIQFIEEKHHYNEKGELSRAFVIKIIGRKEKDIPEKSIKSIINWNGNLKELIEKHFDYLFV